MTPEKTESFEGSSTAILTGGSAGAVFASVFGASPAVAPSDTGGVAAVA